MIANELLGVLHPYIARRMATLVLKAYFDDSGTHGQSRMVTIAGFIGEASVWKEFNSKWKSLFLAPDGVTKLSEFKMYDCVHGVGEFSPPAWSFADRLACAGRAVDILDETDVMAIGSVTVRDAITPLLGDPWFSNKIRGSIYYLCFEHCLQMAVNWTKKYSYVNGVKEKIALVFDEQMEFSETAEKIYREYKKTPHWGDWLVSFTDASSKDFYPLQAADLLAYGTANSSSRKHFPDIARPDFPVGSVFDRLINGVASAGGIYDGESLDGLIKHMIETDEAILAEQKRKLAVEAIRNR